MPPSPLEPLDPTTRAVVVYKLVRAVVALTAAAVLAAALASGSGSTGLHGFVERHATGGISHAAARVLGAGVARHTPSLLVAALAVDAAWSALEAWALRRGRAWGHWLVVIATGVPLPFEAAALVEHASWLRGVLLLVNAAVVFALVRARRRATQS